MLPSSSTGPRKEPTQKEDEQQLREMLRGLGLRRTSQRIAVLHLLTGERGRHLTTAEIHERLVRAGIEVDLATVYRTVTTLLNLGVLHATANPEQPTSFGLAGESHHHAVCTSCGKVVEIPGVALGQAIDVAGRSTGFRLEESVVTVHGVCRDCQVP